MPNTVPTERVAALTSGQVCSALCTHRDCDLVRLAREVFQLRQTAESHRVDLVDLVIGETLAEARAACRLLGMSTARAAGARGAARVLEGTRGWRVLIVDPWRSADLYREVVAAIDHRQATRITLADLAPARPDHGDHQ